MATDNNSNSNDTANNNATTTTTTAANTNTNTNTNAGTPPHQPALVTILEHRNDMYVLLFRSSNKVVTVPATPYNTLKYEHFGGNRIAYRFNAEMEIQETYNDGVFNCTYRDMSMQIRSHDVLAVAVMEHMHYLKPSLYESLFREEYEKLHQVDLLKYMLAGYRDRVRVVTMTQTGSSNNNSSNNSCSDMDVYIDDGLFKIDAHGNAHVLSFDNENDGEVYKKICIVAHGNMQCSNVDTPVGPVRMNEQTVTTLAKAMFLLDPNLDDEVFTRQLPQYVLDELKARKRTMPQVVQTQTQPQTQAQQQYAGLSVRKVVKAVNEAMRRNDRVTLRLVVTQNIENSRKAIEFMPPRNRFFVKRMLEQVTGPGTS
jgi:hypothetical protein